MASSGRCGRVCLAEQAAEQRLPVRKEQSVDGDPEVFPEPCSRSIEQPGLLVEGIGQLQDLM
jgi:hypothetical protein